MTLTYDDYYDLSDRLMDTDGVVSADINDTFGLIAKERTYILRDYDIFLSPYADNGFFNLNPWRGYKLEEKDENGVIVFVGTIEDLKVNDANQVIITASEPMTIFLDWDVDTSDRTTHAGFLTNGFSAQGSKTIQVDTGTTDIPENSVISFNGLHNPNYLVTNSQGSPTKTITLDRNLELDIDDNTTVEVSVPVTTTGSIALKNALETSNPLIRLDGTFDLLHISDLASNYTIYINIKLQDQVSLREHIRAICDMTDLHLFQKNDGVYTVRRGLDYNSTDPITDLTADELSSPIEPFEDKENLIVGYQCIFKSGTNEAKIATAETSQTGRNVVRSKYWNPVTPTEFNNYRHMYANETSASYFGGRRLAYYNNPKKSLSSTCKKSYNIDPNSLIDVYLGKQFNVTVRQLENVKMIVTGYEYNESQQRYTRLILQGNEI